MKRVAILGSTGSIGTQTLDVINNHLDLFRVDAIAGGQNISLLIEQVNKFKPNMVSVATKQLAEEIKLHIPSTTKVYYGQEGLIEIATQSNAEILITAIVGSQGLRPTLAAIDSGKTIGLANKETLVTAGQLITRLIKQKNIQLLPIDSEHSAIFQCLHGENMMEVHKIILTASGGSFRDKSRTELSGVTVKQALQHPNWSMGAKITIDSATMVNKGLEVIEAHWLFQLPYEKIDVLIHPESIIHSLVEFVDHSIIAQLGNPDMRVPISYALTYPHRIPTPTLSLNLAQIGKLHFREMDFNRFPCLKKAYECGRSGGTMPTVFNAANEIAVMRFLSEDVTFLQIEDIIESTIQSHISIQNPSIEEIEQSDQWARTYAKSVVFE
jgi:1-deoxy-D-xylulose-5-phosphate reductoisomerase